MRVFFLLAVVLLGVVVFLLVNRQSGVVSADQSIEASACEPITGLSRPMDINFVKSTSKLAVANFGEGANGGIQLLDIEDPLRDDGWRDRIPEEFHEFSPRSIGVFEEGELSRVFAVNAANRAVEVFDLGGDETLSHRASLSEPRLRRPTDIVAIGPDEFFVSDTPFNRAPGGIVNLLQRVGVATGEVLHYDGVSWRIAADDVLRPGSIALDRGGENLAIADTAADAVKLYHWDRERKHLSFKQNIPVPGDVGHLFIDDANTLWAAIIGSRTTDEQKNFLMRFDLANGARTFISINVPGAFAIGAIARLGDKIVFADADGYRLLICQYSEAK